MKFLPEIYRLDTFWSRFTMLLLPKCRFWRNYVHVSRWKACREYNLWISFVHVSPWDSCRKYTWTKSLQNPYFRKVPIVKRDQNWSKRYILAKSLTWNVNTIPPKVTFRQDSYRETWTNILQKLDFGQIPIVKLEQNSSKSDILAKSHRETWTNFLRK